MEIPNFSGYGGQDYPNFAVGYSAFTFSDFKKKNQRKNTKIILVIFCIFVFPSVILNKL